MLGRQLTLTYLMRSWLIMIGFLSLSAVTSAQMVTNIINTNNATLDGAFGIAVDSKRNVYVAGFNSNNVFKLTPNGDQYMIQEIINSNGDDMGNPLAGPGAVAVDTAGNVYVAGELSDNVFKLTPNGDNYEIMQIMDSNGDNMGNMLDLPGALAVDRQNNLYVTGLSSSNAFKISAGGQSPPVMIIDSSGAGEGKPLNTPGGIAVDHDGNVYIAARFSQNVFKISPEPGVPPQEILSPDPRLVIPFGIAVDSVGNVYVEGTISNNVFKLTPVGNDVYQPEEIMNSNGDNMGNTLNGPFGFLAVDVADNVYVTGSTSNNAFQITPSGRITALIDSNGDGDQRLERPRAIVVDRVGDIYVSGETSDNAFRISIPLDLLVPAYGNPCCGDGPEMWAKLTAAAAQSSSQIHIILNPASGPGDSPIDPNYIGSNGTGPLVDFIRAGGVAYGYVATAFGSKPMNMVMAEIDTYYNPTYWSRAGILISGIFFDEMSNDLANVGYYQTLRDHVKSKAPTARVISNPGTTFTQNPSMQMDFTVMDYAESADILVTFEDLGDVYRNAYTPPAWLNAFPRERFAHLIHAEAAANMEKDVVLAKSRKAGMIYITDDILPNPWDKLACYWDMEVRAVDSIPGPISLALSLLVPAYANPCCGGGPEMWAKLTAASKASPTHVNIILNPASGPGNSPIDPNYIDSNGEGPLPTFTQACGVAYGYVATAFGQKPINTVMAEIDTYYNPNYWRSADIQISGIFFDEMSNDLANVGYYQTLRDHVKSKAPTARVISNPGTTFTNNPSMQTQFTIMDYARSADTLVTFEDTGNTYRNGYTPPAWLNEFPRQHFAHLIHSEAAANMEQDLALAKSRKAGMIYITDDILPNPWDQLATYWDDEVCAVDSNALGCM